jgi:hypothetical protein
MPSAGAARRRRNRDATRRLELQGKSGMQSEMEFRGGAVGDFLENLRFEFQLHVGVWNPGEPASETQALIFGEIGAPPL